MISPWTRKPITKGWKRVLKNSELPLGTERARLRTYMKNKMKLTAAQKANYIKRLNNGESFNKIINTINRTTVPKTNFKSKPPFISWKDTNLPFHGKRGKILRTYIMQELADLEERMSTKVHKKYHSLARRLVKEAVQHFVDEYHRAEYDIVAMHANRQLRQLHKNQFDTSGTLEKVAKAGMGIIFREFDSWFNYLSMYPNPVLIDTPDRIKYLLLHSRQKIIVTAMMRTMRLSFSQLNKKVQNLMKNEKGNWMGQFYGSFYEDPIEFAKKYLLPLTREHKAAKTIQKVVRGGQVRNKIRKNANNLRKKANRAEKLRSVVRASKKRKTPTPTPASSTRIKK